VLGLGLAAAGCRSAPVTSNPPPIAVSVPAAPRVAVAARQDYQQAIQRRLQERAASGATRLGRDEVGYYMDVQQARLQQVGQNRVSVQRQAYQLVVTLMDGPCFEVGSSRLTPDAADTLTALAAILADYRMTLVSVHGHTDASGDEAFNQPLSEQRALAVAEFLLDRGVSRERLVAIGHGQSRPVASNDTSEGRARNRRIELQLDPIVP
jgi:outer membrane protein OmpA-like peptidoglycan-associated protein